MKVTSLTLEDGTTITGRSADRLLALIGSTASRPAVKRAARKAKRAVAKVRMPIADREAFADRNMGRTFQRPSRASNTMYVLLGWSTERAGEGGLTIPMALLERHSDGKPVRIAMKKLMDEMEIVQGVARASMNHVHERRRIHAPFSDAMRVRYGLSVLREGE